MSKAFRFTRPQDLEILDKPKLTVAIVIACRDGQEKLNLVLASLAAQSYPARLISTYIIDDGSEIPLVLPKIKPRGTTIIKYKNSQGHWGKTAATNDVTARLKEDVIWFIDGDMVFDPDHLAHHMKWHHESDDYAVLGWKRFVQSWSYSPANLSQSLLKGDFLELHDESWGKDLWEERVERTNDLVKPALDGYRAFVGATFSLRNSQWKRLGGYNRELITGEDIELGWRIFTSGMRTVVDRQAHSWHLGYSTVEQNKDEIHRHNDPALAQYIPQMHSIRSRFNFDWKVPTYQVVLDARNSNLQQLLTLRTELLALPGTSAVITLLAPWKLLQNRYSPVGDEFAELREIHSWLKGSSEYTFVEVAPDTQLSIDFIIDLFTPGSTPYYLFIEGAFALNLKDLVDYLLASENGLVGVADKEDHRSFAIIAPALARASRSKAWIYSEIAGSFGLLWMTYENFMKINQEKESRISRFRRYLKRETKKINSFRQLVIFIKKLSTLIFRKAFLRG
jgi:GT2 family glycosyltransferase